MASTTAIASNAAPASSSLISIPAGSTYQFFCSVRLQPGEKIKVEQSADDGTTWTEVDDPMWNGRFLDNQTTRNSLSGPGDFRVTKSSTSVAVVVYYDA